MTCKSNQRSDRTTSYSSATYTPTMKDVLEQLRCFLEESWRGNPFITNRTQAARLQAQWQGEKKVSSLPHDVVAFDDRYRPLDLLLVLGKAVLFAGLNGCSLFESA